MARSVIMEHYDDRELNQQYVAKHKRLDPAMTIGHEGGESFDFVTFDPSLSWELPTMTRTETHWRQTSKRDRKFDWRQIAIAWKGTDKMKKQWTFRVFGALPVTALGWERWTRPADLRPLLQQRLSIPMRSKTDPLTNDLAVRREIVHACIGHQFPKPLTREQMD